MHQLFHLINTSFSPFDDLVLFLCLVAHGAVFVVIHPLVVWGNLAQDDVGSTGVVFKSWELVQRQVSHIWQIINGADCVWFEIPKSLLRTECTHADSREWCLKAEMSCRKNTHTVQTCLKHVKLNTEQIQLPNFLRFLDWFQTGVDK